jgi:hypothetical protein
MAYCNVLPEKEILTVNVNETATSKRIGGRASIFDMGQARLPHQGHLMWSPIAEGGAAET